MIPVVAVYLAVSKVWHKSPFQSPDFSLLLQFPRPQLVFCVFQNVLRNQTEPNVGDMHGCRSKQHCPKTECFFRVAVS